MLPASAGMIPIRAVRAPGLSRAPRIRGDDPLAAISLTVTVLCSPHPRG